MHLDQSVQNLSYVAPSGLALWAIPFYVGASPYAVLCRPFGALWYAITIRDIRGGLSGYAITKGNLNKYRKYVILPYVSNA